MRKSPEACRGCGEEALEALGPAGLRPGSVTSDSRLHPTPAFLHRCRVCGLLQKLGTPGLQTEASAIYEAYAPHLLSDGREQVVFDPAGLPVTRTARALGACLPELPARGRLLDFGCGNGAFLRSAGSQLPGWELQGLDVSDHHRAAVESIPGVSGFHAGSLAGLTGGPFDLVVAWHVVEHLQDPEAELTSLRHRLKPGGRLLISVPDVTRNPFDLAVIDHLSHFTGPGLEHLLARSGYRVLLDGRSWIHNCLTYLVEAGDASDLPAGPPAPREPWDWLGETLAHFESVTRDQDYVLFGTGMASIWLLGQLGRRPTVIWDEDEAKVGKALLGIPITRPWSDPFGLPMLMPFRLELATPILGRLKARSAHLSQVRFVLPKGADL